MLSWTPKTIYGLCYLGYHFSTDNRITPEIYLVCCDDRHLSGSAKEQRGRPERHQKEGDVPPKGWSNIRPVFTCTNKIINNGNRHKQHG